MWAEGDVELTCRGGVGTSCFKSIPVVPAHAGNGGEGGGVGSVKELEEWVRRRGGNLPTWCRLYTHICTPPPRPPLDSNGMAAAHDSGTESKAVKMGMWWTGPLWPDQTLPQLKANERLVVSTKLIGLMVRPKMWPSWKCMPLNLSGPHRLAVGDKLLLPDSVRHADLSGLFLLSLSLSVLPSI